MAILLRMARMLLSAGLLISELRSTERLSGVRAGLARYR
jgi:hypothetical protein